MTVAARLGFRRRSSPPATPRQLAALSRLQDNEPELAALLERMLEELDGEPRPLSQATKHEAAFMLDRWASLRAWGSIE